MYVGVWGVTPNGKCSARDVTRWKRNSEYWANPELVFLLVFFVGGVRGQKTYLHSESLLTGAAGGARGGPVVGNLVGNLVGNSVKGARWWAI